jgi:hypothetical protein
MRKHQTGMRGSILSHIRRPGTFRLPLLLSILLIGSRRPAPADELPRRIDLRPRFEAFGLIRNQREGRPFGDFHGFDAV